MTVAQMNVQVFLGGNTTSNSLMSRKMVGMKREKGDCGKAGPPGRSVPETNAAATAVPNWSK